MATKSKRAKSPAAPGKKKAGFSVLDKPWVDETVAIYRKFGFLSAFGPGPERVPAVVAAFEEKFGRVPKWNTPFENERLLALDNDNVFFRTLDVSLAAVIEELAAKSFGSLRIDNVREADGVVHFEVNGGQHVVQPGRGTDVAVVVVKALN